MLRLGWHISYLGGPSLIFYNINLLIEVIWNTKIIFFRPPYILLLGTWSKFATDGRSSAIVLFMYVYVEKDIKCKTTLPRQLLSCLYTTQQDAFGMIYGSQRVSQFSKSLKSVWRIHVLWVIILFPCDPCPSSVF